MPYVVREDYFRSALGPAKPGVDVGLITDSFSVRSGETPIPGADGIKEIVLFGGTKVTPGNFGTVNIGSASNGTPDLVRQIKYGANASDFEHPNFTSKVTNGALYAPNTFDGDPGVSAGVESAFQSIVGKTRLIALYSAVTGNGSNTKYTISGFVGVTIVSVELRGNPKLVIAQPTGFFSNKVTSQAPPTGTATAIEGVYPPPQLIIP